MTAIGNGQIKIAEYKFLNNVKCFTALLFGKILILYRYVSGIKNRYGMIGLLKSAKINIGKNDNRTENTKMYFDILFGIDSDGLFRKSSFSSYALSNKYREKCQIVNERMTGIYSLCD